MTIEEIKFPAILLSPSSIGIHSNPFRILCGYPDEMQDLKNSLLVSCDQRIYRFATVNQGKCLEPLIKRWTHNPKNLLHRFEIEVDISESIELSELKQMIQGVIERSGWLSVTNALSATGESITRLNEYNARDFRKKIDTFQKATSISAIISLLS